MDETNWVMVPVPQELVPDVLRHVLALTVRSSIQPWDEASMAQLFASLDEVTRSVLSLAARAALAERDALVDSVAEAVQLTTPEVLKATRDITARAEQASRLPLLSVRTVVRTLPSGRESQRRVMVVEQDVAELIRAIEQAERNADPRLVPGARG